MNEFVDLMGSRYQAYKAEDYSLALELASQAYSVANNDRDRAHALRDQAAALHRIDQPSDEWHGVEPMELIDESIVFAGQAITQGIDLSMREKGASVSWKARLIMNNLLLEEDKTKKPAAGKYWEPNELIEDALGFYTHDSPEGEYDQYRINDIPVLAYGLVLREEFDRGLIYAKHAISLAKYSESKRLSTSSDSLTEIERAKARAVSLTRGLGAYASAIALRKTKKARPAVVKSAIKLKVA